MPILKNTKWEIFSQEVCKGENYKVAMLNAGYKDSRHLAKNSTRLTTNPLVVGRIAELKQELADKYILSREDILVAMGKIIKDGTDTNKISASGLAAKLQGFLEDTVKIKVKGDRTYMTEEELTAILNKADK